MLHRGLAVVLRKKQIGWLSHEKRLLLHVHFGFPIFLVLNIPYIALVFMVHRVYAG